MRIDWSKREGRDAFLNVKEHGPHSSGLTTDCVTFHAEERDVIGVGVETVGTDAGQGSGMETAFPYHHLMYWVGKHGWRV